MTTRTFPGNFRSLAPISRLIILLAEEAGFSPADVYAIQTAVDEACSNIIDHAYGGEDIGDIRITVTNIKNGLKIVLKDHGKSFNPDEIPEPDLTSQIEYRRERGLGIFFIRQLMDEVIFDFSESRGNTLTLVKYKGK